MKEEINKAVDELREAMLENVEAGVKEDQAKQAKIKARNRLLLAKDTINELCH